MKGQYRLVGELLIFSIGIFIAYVSSTSLGNIEDMINSISTQDQLVAVSDFFSLAILKTYQAGENSTIRFTIPDYISGKSYRIRAYNGMLLVSLGSDERINVTHEIFNISSGKVIIGDLYSSSKYIIIKNNITAIEISRG